MNLTAADFDRIARRIRHDKNSHWRDLGGDLDQGKIWIDPQGNWYSWTGGGRISHLFYAGELWEKTVRTSRTTPDKVTVKQVKPTKFDLEKCKW